MICVRHEEIIAAGGGGLLLLLTLIQIAPIKINPWSAVGKVVSRGLDELGQLLTKEALAQIHEIRADQTQIKAEQEQIKLEQENQKATADRREADGWRTEILRFNMELVHGDRHERENFVEILSVIDKYEKYCDSHENYENNRAVHAIANIERCYDERLMKNDFA